MSKNIPIGEVLREYGYITDEQLKAALMEQKKDERRRLGAVLLEMGFVTELQILDAMGKKLGYRVLDLDIAKINIKTVARIPKQIAKKYNVLAIDSLNGKLLIAMSDPLNLYAREDIRQITGAPLEIVLAQAEQIRRAIDYHYSEVNARQAAIETEIYTSESGGITSESTFDEDESDAEAPVVKLLNSLLVKACSTNTSDIHIEPFEKNTSVRMRIDGVIMDYVSIASSVHSAVIARIKIMSGMDIAEKRVPQDGHFKTRIEGYLMNVRVSVIPTAFGEKAVLRFLSNDASIDRVGSFGMNDEAYGKFKEMLGVPGGIIYITGPTGSGKTTTLYLALEYLAKQQVNVSTIEDPIERNIPRVNQMQVDVPAGLTFESGLKALLRQDPDIIMIGETHDPETALISVRAAITGHLVLSTLHTNDAVSSIMRLCDMGVPNYMISGSLIGVVAQRLVRKLCPHCSYDYSPTLEELSVLGRTVSTLRRSKGCHICSNTGYRGRIAIHEILRADPEIRHFISRNAPRDEIEEYTRDIQKMKTLHDCMAELVAQGVTSIDEMIKVSYSFY